MGIDTIIKERHLLTHPFYERWQKGKVSIEVLREYARQYYHYETALPSFLSSALEHLEEGPAKAAVQQVYVDETSEPRPHAELWLEFAEGLGVKQQDVLESQPSPRTTNLVETYKSLCKRGSEEALGALYSYESQFPEVAKAKADGLREYYEITDEKTLAFFDLHSTLDVEHGKAIREGFTDSELSRESAHLAIDAWWGMLDQFEQMSVSAA
ncbi:MAG: iron-containing redox enzyme family protein [Actinomycetota bacterium]|nr:iron-containing redox enzyme family protein [Actinomycetota bacterium]